MFVQVTDITERKRMEDLLFEEKERMRLTLSPLAMPWCAADAQGQGHLPEPRGPAPDRLAGV
jgi:PAS domain-containing protein